VKNPLFIISGKADDLRPWEHCKVTYYGRVAESQMYFVEGMGHSVTQGTEEVLRGLLPKLLGESSKM
jgi:esterase/lipase